MRTYAYVALHIRLSKMGLYQQWVGSFISTWYICYELCMKCFHTEGRSHYFLLLSWSCHFFASPLMALLPSYMWHSLDEVNQCWHILIGNTLNWNTSILQEFPVKACIWICRLYDRSLKFQYRLTTLNIVVTGTDQSLSIFKYPIRRGTVMSVEKLNLHCKN